MSEVTIDTRFLLRLQALDADLDAINEAKIDTIFQALGIKLSSLDREKMLGWECIVVSVPDRQMAVQLNKLAGYVPKLIFCVLPDQPLFTLSPGLKKRRVRKDR